METKATSGLERPSYTTDSGWQFVNISEAKPLRHPEI